MNGNNQLDILLEKKDGSKKAYVKYHTDKSLRHNNIYDYIEELFDLDETLSKEDDLIIITKDVFFRFQKITCVVEKRLQKISLLL